MISYLLSVIISSSFALISCAQTDHHIYTSLSIRDHGSYFNISAYNKQDQEVEDITYFSDLNFSEDSIYAKKEQDWMCLLSHNCSLKEFISYDSRVLSYSKFYNSPDLDSQLVINATDCSY
jgi:hypothetical protein